MRWQLVILFMLMSCTKQREAKTEIHEVSDRDAGKAPLQDTQQHAHAIGLGQPARRIVSLSPALTETLFAVGCGDAIVLRDGWSDYPPRALAIPAVQGFVPSPEAILAARPDLVLTHFPPPALASALDAAHVPWLAFAPKHLVDVAATFRAVGEACGRAQAGEQLATAFDKRIKGIDGALQGLASPLVFYEMDAGIGGQPYTIGQATFGHEVLTRAGGRNLFANEQREWFQVSPEAVLNGDPDVVLLGDADVPEQPQSLETLRRRPTMMLLRAVQAGQVFPLHAELVSRPGPRLALGVEESARLLHPLALWNMAILQPLSTDSAERAAP
jgi:iron complex transport system substrate-binding protein